VPDPNCTAFMFGGGAAARRDTGEGAADSTTAERHGTKLRGDRRKAPNQAAHSCSRKTPLLEAAFTHTHIQALSFVSDGRTRGEREWQSGM